LLGGRHPVGRSGPILEPGTMRVYVSNGPRNGLHIDRKVGPCPGSRRRWVLSSVHAFLQPFVTQTHTVPGSRLGPDLPSLSGEDSCFVGRQKGEFPTGPYQRGDGPVGNTPFCLPTQGIALLTRWELSNKPKNQKMDISQPNKHTNPYEVCLFLFDYNV